MRTLEPPRYPSSSTKKRPLKEPPFDALIPVYLHALLLLFFVLVFRESLYVLDGAPRNKPGAAVL